MAVDANFASLFENLKLEDPWLPPRTWESIPSESGHPPSSSSSSQPLLYQASIVSEESLVRLAMNALQGVEAALVSIEKLSAAFSSEPADRTFHRIPTLWTRASSTHALGKILSSIASSGSLVFLLLRFVDYFTNSETQNHNDSLVNQAFGVAVGKVLEGYMCALNTLYASVDIIAKAALEFPTFYRGGDLLTYLYTQLQVADHSHRALLKFLFLRSCEPYCGFIRSWIFKAEISDPYKEFIVEYSNKLPPNQHGNAGISVDIPLPSIREQDGVAVPCFLKDFLVPLVRAGQQLQVLMKLLEMYIYVATGDHTHEDFLPCWSGFSSSYLSSASPVSFSKVNIEAMVLARDSYYKMMQEKLEFLLTKLKFRHEQLVPCSPETVFFANDGRILNNSVSFTLDDSSIAPSTADKRSSNVAVNVDGDDSCSIDELSYVMDTYESSECSSSNSSEEQIESEQLIEPPSHTKYLSALSFSVSNSMDISLQKPRHYKNSCHIENNSHGICEVTDSLGHDVHSHNQGVLLSQLSVLLESEESNCSFTSDILHTDSLPDKVWSLGCPHKDSDLNLRKTNVGVIKEGTSYFCKILATLDASIREATGKGQLENSTYTPSHLYTLRSCKSYYQSNCLSENPMLTKYAFLHSMSKPGERCNADYGRSLPYFDFTSVEDPCKLCVEQVAAGSVHEIGSELPLLMDSHASSTSSKSDHHGQQGYDGDHVLIDNTEASCYIRSPSDLKDHKQEAIKNVSGGSSWESLLGNSSVTIDSSVGDHRQSLLAMFEIPLDFIIEKCLLQEIILQSGVLLSQIRDFQKFKVSLSCQFRGLHVGGTVIRIGVHSFDFIGLGYRVDWPLSIVLTPSALQIYAEIFSFLVKVKLAVFSLTDVWRFIEGMDS
uniref:Gamma-tubulin complex component n=1 Tax=Fagus sylvatica TaxID=28930 RepID=A0A2N9EPG6_FAGSY